MSRVIIVCASTHRGKSTLIKKMIKGKKNLVNDIKKEYGKGFKKWHDNKDLKGFLTFVSDNITNTCVVLEEASFYISNKHYSNDCEKLFINKWQSKNVYILVYHAIRKIPLWVYDYSDVMILFHTRDQLHHIDKHPPEVLKAYEEVKLKTKKNKYYRKFIRLDDIE